MSFRRALKYPENLGIGKREGAREADLYYWLGKALHKSGKTESAYEAWKKAAIEKPSKNVAVEKLRKLAEQELEALRKESQKRKQ